MPGERFGMVPVSILADPQITPAVGWTYAALASYADRDRVARPGWRALGELRGIDKGTLSRHLAALVSLGYIERLQPAGWHGRGRTQQYRLIHSFDRNGRGDANHSEKRARGATRNARVERDAPLFRIEQSDRGLFLPGSGWIRP